MKKWQEIEGNYENIKKLCYRYSAKYANFQNHDDLASDVMVALLGRMASGERIDNVEAMLQTMAKNHGIDAIRKESSSRSVKTPVGKFRRFGRHSNISLDAAIPGREDEAGEPLTGYDVVVNRNSPNPYAVVALKQEAQIAWFGIRQLTLPERLVYVLSVFGELEDNEIRDCVSNEFGMELSADSIRQHRSRAMKKIKEVRATSKSIRGWCYADTPLTLGDWLGAERQLEAGGAR